jgi:hypothetical protein
VAIRRKEDKTLVLSLFSSPNNKQSDGLSWLFVVFVTRSKHHAYYPPLSTHLFKLDSHTIQTGRIKFQFIIGFSADIVLHMNIPYAILEPAAISRQRKPPADNTSILTIQATSFRLG